MKSSCTVVRPSPSKLRHRRRGFTLVEVLLTIALLVLLASLLVLNVDKIFQGGQSSGAQIFVEQVSKTALRQYYFHLGSYPSTAEGLKALIDKPSGANAGKWAGPYLEELPKDPWDEDYQYRYPGEKNPQSYDIWSKGPDKASGTADDIGNWGE